MSETEAVENAIIEKFIAFLARAGRGGFAVTARAKKVDGGVRNFDFEISQTTTGERLAVEIFRLFDRLGSAEIEKRHTRYWIALTKALRAKVTEPVLVTFPHWTAPLLRDIDTLAESHASAIRDALAATPARTLSVEGFEVERMPMLRQPAVASSAQFEWVDRDGQARPQFEKSLPRKDSQLHTDAHQRIVLVANHSWSLDVDDAIPVIATMDTSSLENTDQVWLEERGRGSFHLAFDRRVRDAFAGLEDPRCDPEAADLLQLWLDAKLNAGLPEGLALVRRLSDSSSPQEWLRSADLRANVVRAASRAAEKGDLELGRWALAAFKNDPDPEGPPPPKLSPRADDAITTVRGQVCWLAQALVVHGPAAVEALLTDIEALARDPNHGVRHQALVPLIELAVRRNCRVDGRPYYSQAVCDRVRALVLEMTEADWPSPAAARRVMRAVLELRDLDERETERILRRARTFDDVDVLRHAAQLLIGAAEYSRFSRRTTQFFSQPFKELLREAMSGSSAKFRAALIAEFRCCFEDPKADSARLVPYLGLSIETAASFKEFMNVFAALSAGACPKEDELEVYVVAAARAAMARLDRSHYRVAFETLLPAIERLAEQNSWEAVAVAIEGLGEGPNRFSKALADMGEVCPDDALSATLRSFAAV